MDKDHYWTVDKLIPPTDVSASQRFRKNTGVPIRELTLDPESKTFLSPIVLSSSRVVQSYSLTAETIDHSADPILSESIPNSHSNFVPCHSFSPNLAQFSDQQKGFFFYFSSRCDHKIKINTSFPYLQLYLCRLIRSEIPPELFWEKLLWVWKAYRDEFPLCDRLFSDVASDYAFYKNTPLPYSLFSDLITDRSFAVHTFLSELFLFDYLFAENHPLNHKEYEYILRIFTDCAFRKTKAYRYNKRYAATLEEALAKTILSGVFNKKELNEKLFSLQIPCRVSSVRKMFAQLPTSHRPDLNIRLSFYPLLRDDNIKNRIEEIIRYTENRIRNIFKIKNSLSRIHISIEHKAYLDALLFPFEALAPIDMPSSNTKADETNGYERKPLDSEDINININPDLAREIEEDSWQITQSLTTIYQDENEESVAIGEEHSEIEPYQNDLDKMMTKQIPLGTDDFWEFVSLLTDQEEKFIQIHLYQGMKAAREFAIGEGLFFESLLSSCNFKASQTIDDTVFSSDGSLYHDYIDSLMSVIVPTEGETNV